MSEKNLFGEEEIELSDKEKKYNCLFCHGQKTVRWDDSILVWICPDCGTIDTRRTNERSK